MTLKTKKQKQMKKQLLTLCASLIGCTAIAQTTITLQPDAAAGKDAEIFSCVPCGYANTNYGTKKDFDAIAWTNNGNSSNVRSLIEFDLSGIPAGATISDARLSLYFNPGSPEGKHVSSLFNKNSSYIERITAPWGESTVTWNNQPSTTTQNRVSLAATTSNTQNFTGINVTQLIRDMIANPGAGYGFMFKLQQEHVFKKLIFCSSDHLTASLRPMLKITYTVPSPRVAGTGSLTDFSIAPNPAHAQAMLFIKSISEDVAVITLSDITGKIVSSESISISNGQNQTEILLASLPKGIYFVTVKTAGKGIAKKLVVD